MARQSKYSKYADKIETEPQSVYLNSGSAFRHYDELHDLRVRRILFVCNLATSKYKNVQKLIEFYKTKSFRVFEYYRTDSVVTDKNIQEGLKVYEYYSCDAIVVVGGSDDINCGKMIAAAASNPVKKLSDLSGIDRLKNDIPVLCCIVTDNSDVSSSSIAEYFEVKSGKWVTCMSAFLIPQIVCYDTDFSVRTEPSVLQISSLLALMSAVEAYLSPLSVDRPKYRANAVNCCINIIDSFDKMISNPSDSYARRVCAVGGMYAGLAMRKCGLGQAHILMRYLANKYKTEYGVGINRIFPMFLRAELNTHAESLAELAKELHLCTPSLDVISAATVFVERIEMMYSGLEMNYEFPHLSSSDAKKIANAVVHDAHIYGSTGSVSINDMASIILATSIN